MATNTAVPLAEVTTLRSAEIERMPWQAVAGCPGVYVKVLARDTSIVCALIMYEPGASTPGRPHPVDQYLWVTSGQAHVAGQWLDAGSAAHVPAGTTHPITAGSHNGCVLLQVQLHPGNRDG